MNRQAFLIKRKKGYLKPEKPVFFEDSTHSNNGTTIPVSQIKPEDGRRALIQAFATFCPSKGRGKTASAWKKEEGRLNPEGEKKVRIIKYSGNLLLISRRTGFTCSYSPREAQWTQTHFEEEHKASIELIEFFVSF